MKHFLLAVATAGASSILLLGCRAGASDADPEPQSEQVRVEVLDDESRVDVYVNDQLFTSYLYTDTLSVLKKPVLYPINTAEGIAVTRAFPLDVRAGERIDHPHQIGLWLNYGNVNGLDFWNNSDAIPEDRADQMGTIRHRSIVESQSGDGQGTLVIDADWQNSVEETLLEERTRFDFRAEPGARVIDRTTTLTAAAGPVALADHKEGVLGLRVRRELEMPTGEKLILTDASGEPLPDTILNEEGVSGSYRNSEGVAGYPDVWGTRASWTALSGVVDGDSVTVAIFDHPENVGYPTYWHARDYGLFAANPLGQKELSGGQEELDFALDDGESVTFRYRVAIYSSHPADEEINATYADFINR